MGEIEKRDNSESYSETELSEIKVIEQLDKLYENLILR